MGARNSGSKQPGLLDRAFVALLCISILPTFIGPVPLVKGIRWSVTLFAAVMSTFLVYSAPLLIPLLVWNALGVEPVRLDIPYSQRPVTLQSTEKGLAYTILGLVSAAIQAAQLHRQSQRVRHERAAVVALTTESASQRLPASPQYIPLLRTNSMPMTALAESESSEDGAPLEPTVPAVAAVNLEELEALWGELREVRLALESPEAATTLEGATPRSFFSAAFEMGRLCGVVGIEIDPALASGEMRELRLLLGKLKSHVL